MSTHSVELEPGSFRDPDSRILYTPDGVLRTLSERGLEDFRALAETKFFAAALERGTVVHTELLDSPPELPGVRTEGSAAALRHDLLPFVSYPYEWPFGMLKEAALLQLELVAAALEEQMILKDSSPYNVQWRGTQPVFVDIGSFERLREGEPWVGYRQFCMLFLYPLMLQAYKDVPYHPWLRGAIDGIEPSQIRALMSRGDLARGGVLKHVSLHARLERSYEDKQRDTGKELRSAGFNSELIKANVKGLRKLVSKLEWEPGKSEWSDYGQTKTYSDSEEAEKDAFVSEVAGTRRWKLVWDLGCNDGRYTRLAAAHADYALAVDADQLTVERLYRRLREEGDRSILPLVMNVADPSPNLGWRGVERKSMPARGRPELTLCLALVHHVAISANVPVREFLDWLAELGTALIIEFPTREDPMVKRLLTGKREDANPDYELGYFERALGERFDIELRQELSSGTRVLFYARPRGEAAAA